MCGQPAGISIPAMPLYRVHFVDHGGRVFGADEMECEHDAEAIERAREIHRHGIGMGYEIWQAERRIHIERRS